MKIGFIEPHLLTFGGIRRIVDMANRLSDRGHDVTIYHSDGSPCTWLEVRAKIATGRAVLDADHDVILYNDPELEDMYLATHARSKVTFYYALGLYRRDLLAGFHPTIYMGRHKRTRYLRRCLRSPHVNLANSTWIHRWLQEAGFQSILCMGGVNFDIFHPVDTPRDDGTAGAFRILCSGDRRLGKGTDTIEAAVGIVRRELPDVVLETYHGKGIPQDEMAATYGRADLFADATWNNGGWNNVVAEAMACGVPVVCTHNGQVEDFAMDEQTALMSERHDVEALAANILRMAHDSELRTRIASNALAHIRTFEWDKSIARFEQIAAELTGAAP